MQIVGNYIAGSVVVGGVISALAVSNSDRNLYDKRLSTSLIAGGVIAFLNNSIFLTNKIRAKRDLLESYTLMMENGQDVFPNFNQRISDKSIASESQKTASDSA